MITRCLGYCLLKSSTNITTMSQKNLRFRGLLHSVWIKVWYFTVFVSISAFTRVQLQLSMGFTTSFYLISIKEVACRKIIHCYNKQIAILFCLKFKFISSKVSIDAIWWQRIILLGLRACCAVIRKNAMHALLKVNDLKRLGWLFVWLGAVWMFWWCLYPFFLIYPQPMSYFVFTILLK